MNQTKALGSNSLICCQNLGDRNWIREDSSACSRFRSQRMLQLKWAMILLFWANRFQKMVVQVVEYYIYNNQEIKFSLQNFKRFRVFIRRIRFLRFINYNSNLLNEYKYNYYELNNIHSSNFSARTCRLIWVYRTNLRWWGICP